MKRKKLPQQKHKGLYIYCSNNKCKKFFSWTHKNTKQKDGSYLKEEPLCGVSQKKLSSCKFYDKHKYISRIHIPGSSNRKTSKILTATSYNDAVLQAIDFRDEFSNELQMKYSPVNSSNQRHYLIQAQTKYMEFLNNIGVPEHKKIQRAEKTIQATYKSLLLFNEALKKNKVNKKLLLIDRITDDHVGFFHAYLLNDKGYQNRTYNNNIGELKRFYAWAIKKYRLNISNPFEDARKRSTSTQNDTISKDEFKRLLEIISVENGMKIIQGKKRVTKRNMYKPYLKDGIELGLHTGGRGEEVVQLKWNMIKEIDGEMTYIVVDNLKVQRMKGKGFNENVKPKIIPITKSLKLLLYRMGYEHKKGRDEFLLSPNRTNISPKTIIDNLSKGFTHYYQQLNTGRNIQFKNLRKTYLTYLNAAMSGDTKLLSSHTTDEVLQKHYIDERIVNKAVKNLRIFDV